MKKLIISFIAGALFATAGTAAATTIIEKITASVRTDYSVEVDGQKVEIQKAPLVYDGSAYIAVREISTIIGKDVDFDSGVIKINSKDPINVLEMPVSEMNLEQVNHNIKMYNTYWRGENLKYTHESTPEEEKAEIKKKMEQYEQRLAELEARKAELESE